MKKILIILAIFIYQIGTTQNIHLPRNTGNTTKYKIINCTIDTIIAKVKFYDDFSSYKMPKVQLIGTMFDTIYGMVKADVLVLLDTKKYIIYDRSPCFDEIIIVIHKKK